MSRMPHGALCPGERSSWIPNQHHPHQLPGSASSARFDNADVLKNLRNVWNRQFAKLFTRNQNSCKGNGWSSCPTFRVRGNDGRRHLSYLVELCDFSFAVGGSSSSSKPKWKQQWQQHCRGIYQSVRSVRERCRNHQVRTLQQIRLRFLQEITC